MTYTGLPPKLKRAIFERDNFRCRWCGATNQPPYDVHHITYRRGYVHDVPENLITLCRRHHDFVHDSYLIPKERAQEILRFLLTPEGTGMTGLAVERHGHVEADPMHGIGRTLLSMPEPCGCPHARARHHRGRCLAPGCECGDVQNAVEPTGNTGLASPS